MLATIFLIVVVICLIVILHKQVSIKHVVKRAEFEEFTLGRDVSESDIPKVIWTYWDDCPTEITMGFIKTWIDKNPDHKVIVLTRKNYTKFAPRVLESSLMLKYPKLLPELIRTNVLMAHGGIWMDPSIICNESLSWVHTVQKNTGIDVVGYHNSDLTEDDKRPAFETWFLACKPGCDFVNHVGAELLTAASRFARIDGYAKSVKDTGVRLPAMSASTEQLTPTHVAIQKVIQTGSYSYKTFDSNAGPYLYLRRREDKKTSGLQMLTTGSFDQPLIKITESDRNKLATDDKLARKFFAKFNVTDYMIVKDADVCALADTSDNIVLDIKNAGMS